MTQLLTFRRFAIFVLLISVAWGFAACAVKPEEAESPQNIDTSSSAGAAIDDELEGDEDLPSWARMVDTPEKVKNPFVFIKIIKTHGTPSWLLAPRTVGVCKTAKEDCGDTVTWRWLPPMSGVTKIQIEAKVDQGDCFDTLDLVSTVPVSATVNPDNTECPEDTIWYYQVTCTGSEDDCPPPLDPQVHIQN
jgi:hypothetical protein